MFDERRIHKHGVRAQATVVAMREHNHHTSNDYQRYDYVLDVRPDGEMPFQIENTIIAGNTGTNPDISGTITSQNPSVMLAGVSSFVSLSTRQRGTDGRLPRSTSGTHLPNAVRIVGMFSTPYRLMNGSGKTKASFAIA